MFHKMILAVFVLLALPFAEYAAYGNGGDLVRAAKKGDAERVKRLLDQGTKPNYEDPGWSALHWASVRRHLKVVELLVSAGADVNARTKDGLTPLHSVIHRSYPQCFEGCPGLDESEQHSDLEVLHVLLEKGAFLTLKDKNGHTTLDYARRRQESKPKVLRLLEMVYSLDLENIPRMRQKILGKY